MAVRFEVVHNGKRVCTSGIDGDGVLNVMLCYVKHADSDPKYDLEIGGLGHYHPARPGSQHVSWPRPETVGIGDEITIRLLPPGDFDPPVGMAPLTAGSIDDPLLGHIDYNIDAWNGTASFDFPPFTSAHVHMVESADGPSDSQRALFQEFKNRHPDLWPVIADALVRCHPEIESRDELLRRIRPEIGINMYDDSGSLEISYSVDGDPEHRAYVVTVRNWEIAEISSVT